MQWPTRPDGAGPLDDSFIRRISSSIVNNGVAKFTTHGAKIYAHFWQKRRRLWTVLGIASNKQDVARVVGTVSSFGVEITCKAKEDMDVDLESFADCTRGLPDC